MEDIIDEIRTWKRKFDGKVVALDKTNEVYEIALDSCQIVTGMPCFSGPTPWTITGMTNNIKPMWAIIIDIHILAFVWKTETSPDDITIQEITGVECEEWRIYDIEGLNNRDKRAVMMNKRANLLGITKWSTYQIKAAGFQLSLREIDY
jgi:hypothetical protein